MVHNRSSQGLALDRLALLVAELQLGEQPGRHTVFKNGYQSWSQSRSFAAPDRDRVPILHAMTVMQDNPRNLPSPKPGEFTSDMFAVLGNLDAQCFLLSGQTGGFSQFFYIRSHLPADGAALPSLELEFDFGGQMLAPGAQMPLDEVVLVASDHANRIQDVYFDLIRSDRGSGHELPSGWCSWYYYYAKVSQQDLSENLAAVRERGVSWHYFVLDDGYESAVGDWLYTNDRFPPTLAPIARDIRAAGMAPGLWIAPFIARSNSHLFHDHPDWLLRDAQGRPVLAGWNPTWGLEGRFYGLDTTHPGFQEQLRLWMETVVREWGFRFLKLDFTYGASLHGRAYDQTLSAAERLALGYRIIRETAGEDVLIVGCGSPLSPAIGWVDAMRIGPDVAPYWFARYRYHLTRDPHALCTKFAMRNILNRCQMHRRLWINDPDCLMLREVDTKLTSDERMSLVNSVIVTGGMHLISDRLNQLPSAVWDQMDTIARLVGDCDRGRAWALDYMEREIPEMVYNSRGYLGVFNFADQPSHKSIELRRYLDGILPEDAQFVDVWNGEKLAISGGVLDVGPMKAHSSRLLQVQG
jgi:alpha-galactosidase